MTQEEKITELLVTGRLTIYEISRDSVLATAISSDGRTRYTVGQVHGAWSCTCPASEKASRLCYHLAALRRICAVHDAPGIYNPDEESGT